MSKNTGIKYILTIVAFSAILLVSLLIYQSFFVNRAATVAVWREDFSFKLRTPDISGHGGWVQKNKPGTRAARFTVEPEDNKGGYLLHMESDRASSTLITRVENIDLNKTPIMRWRWRVKKLPADADGRVRSKDDQAIGIYVGYGSSARSKSVSYRWDTVTPKGASGDVSYGLGFVKVKWYTIRNLEDGVDRWFEEERNVADDLNKAWGICPKSIYIGVSCNSQYTNSDAVAELDWIEFVSR